MNWRQINTSREIRLWVTTVIVPVTLSAATIIATNPKLLHDSLEFARRKINNFKNTRGNETV